MLSIAFGSSSSTAVRGDDARLSDARAPLPGSSSYIQASPQSAQGASINISGDVTFGGALHGDGSQLTGVPALNAETVNFSGDVTAHTIAAPDVGAQRLTVYDDASIGGALTAGGAISAQDVYPAFRAGLVLDQYNQFGPLAISSFTWQPLTNGRSVMQFSQGDYLAFTDQSLFYEPNVGLSISAWVSTQAAFSVVDYYECGPYFLTLQLDDQGLPFAVYDRNSTRPYVRGTQPVTDGQWHHLAFTHDDKGLVDRLFVDGALVNENTAASATPPLAGPLDLPNGSWPVLVGASINCSKQLVYGAGMIDGLRVWKRALPLTEVQAGYQATRGLYPMLAVR